MSQNIYDNPDFFEKYSHLNRQIHGFDGAPEWSSVKALLPDLSGKRVLDLGCGFGWFCRYAMEQGAKNVLGIDISKNMIAKAKSFGDYPTISYKIADLEELELQKNSFDFAYSSLAFHYIKDFKKLITTIHHALIPNSYLIFTIEHPIFMAPKYPGWQKDKNGERIWPLNHYQIEGERTTDWLAKGIVKQHRTLGTTINTLIETGFHIRHVEEWRPTEEQLKQHPEWDDELDCPSFLLISSQLI